MLAGLRKSIGIPSFITKELLQALQCSSPDKISLFNPFCVFNLRGLSRGRHLGHMRISERDFSMGSFWLGKDSPTSFKLINCPVRGSSGHGKPAHGSWEHGNLEHDSWEHGSWAHGNLRMSRSWLQPSLPLASPTPPFFFGSTRRHSPGLLIPPRPGGFLGERTLVIGTFHILPT